MTDQQPEEPAEDGPTSPTVPVTINVPVGLLSGYDDEVEAGLYADRDAAFLDALVEGWRHHKGRYSTLRVDIGLSDREHTHPDNAKPDLGDIAAAADDLKAGEEDAEKGDEGT